MADVLSNHPDAQSTQPDKATLTVFESTSPPLLTKHFRLGQGGSLEKSTSAAMYEGCARQHQVTSLDELSDLLQRLRPNQALGYGVAGFESVGIVTERAWLNRRKPEGWIPRTKDHFHWSAGPGVFMLDYDPEPGAESLAPDDLVAALGKAAPGLNEASMLWYPSSSSHICNGEEDLTGLRGQRLYLLVKDATDIPRAGAALVARLWITGFGRIQVSTSGHALERTLFDASVWQPNRLDFAAGAHCEPPLRQERGFPRRFDGIAEFVDTRHAIPDLSKAEQEQLLAIKAKAKQAIHGQIDSARKAFGESLTARLAEADARTDSGAQLAAAAIEDLELRGCFPVIVVDGDEEREVSVDEILNNVGDYDRCLTLDPLEPEYDGRRPVGKLYLDGHTPNLFSFAHGGRTFRLHLGRRCIEVISGQTHVAVENAVSVLREHPRVFDFDQHLVLVEDGTIHYLSEYHLRQWLPSIVELVKVTVGADGERRTAPIDPPSSVCKQILELGVRRRLKTLTAVTTAPTIRPDGSVLQEPGFDETTGIFVDCQMRSRVEERPSIAKCQAALKTLMEPFNGFPFCDELDRAVLLCALLTAACRPALPTAPAFAIDAPKQGSGKSLLACAIGAMATGAHPDIWPHTKARDDEEVRKRIFTVLRNGNSVVVWDNVVGEFRSAAFAAALTSTHFSDRVLGKSESQSVPNRALFIITGNNLRFAEDLPRRVYCCRIDPGVERPHAREFAFDPVERVLARRIELVGSALTLVRGWLSAESGIGRVPGRTASFELWDDFVRQTVAWVGKEVAPGQFGDVMEKLDLGAAADPDLEILRELLRSWVETLGDLRVTAQELKDKLTDWSVDDPLGSTADLAQALTELGWRGDSTKSLGKILARRVDQMLDGMALRSARDTARNVQQWWVERVKEKAK